jgi:hypothetical protein
MRETQFIQQNKEKWSDFERVLTDPHKDPDKLHDVFIQITDDLSHARTFYPSRSVRAYLNGVAQLIFTDLYNRKKSPLSNYAFFSRMNCRKWFMNPVGRSFGRFFSSPFPSPSAIFRVCVILSFYAQSWAIVT